MSKITDPVITLEMSASSWNKFMNRLEYKGGICAFVGLAIAYYLTLE